MEKENATIENGMAEEAIQETTVIEKCINCGAELAEGQEVCPKCGAARLKKDVCGNVTEQSSVDTSGLTQVKNPISNPVSAEKRAEELSNKISRGRAFFPLGGIASGIVSILFGLIMLGKDVGNYVSSSAYGGDAYTGIQNAAAQTANNVRSLSEIANNGFAFLLIAIGLIAIFYFASRLSKK